MHAVSSQPSVTVIDFAKNLEVSLTLIAEVVFASKHPGFIILQEVIGHTSSSEFVKNVFQSPSFSDPAYSTVLFSTFAIFPRVSLQSSPYAASMLSCLTILSLTLQT